MKVCIYARVSTQDQHVEQQTQICKEYCKRLGWEVVWTLEDKESGSKELFERKKFQRIIKTINGTADSKERYNFLDKCDAILVFKIDRLSRNWFDGNEIEKAFSINNELKVNLLSTCEPIDFLTPVGKMMFRQFFLYACFERDTLVQRTMVGVNRAKAEGKYKGRKKGSKNKPKTRREPSKSIGVSKTNVRFDTHKIPARAKKYLNDNKELMGRLSKD